MIIVYSDEPLSELPSPADAVIHSTMSRVQITKLYHDIVGWRVQRRQIERLESTTLKRLK